MTTTKSEKKEERMKMCPKEDKEEVQDIKKKKKEHPVSESPKSTSFNNSSSDRHYTKPPSAPLSAKEIHSHSMSSDGDLQMVVANSDHEAIPEPVTKTLMSVMNDIGEVEQQDITSSGVMSGNKWYIVLLVMRIIGFVLCKIGFAIVAADKVTVFRRVLIYWNNHYEVVPSLYRLYQHPEFKYLLSINVFGFVYSGIQIGDLLKYFITKTHTFHLDPKLRGYFNIAMDQVLAYCLISASSSAATGVSYWKKYLLGANKFVDMANASVAFSFVAFLAFATSSLVSAVILSPFA
ncbi:hypothetical protein RJT34_27775 [Clitoria ternatea]|uniref:CASP-like protein n=1 Tax=Clitoria ternatea TaxID=43366 RepID=A0AAN9IGI1_CLITE